MPDPTTGEAPRHATGGLYFEVFNEIGIIAQLSRALFEGAQNDGLTVPHFSVLNHLVRLGDGTSPLALARAFQTPKASMTNTLAGLAARGLITMRRNPADARSKLVFLTDAGRARRAAAIARSGPVIARALARHDHDAARAMLPLLKDLRRELDTNRS